MTNFKKTFSFILAILVLIIVGLVTWLYYDYKSEAERFPIDSQFEEKIVYTTNLDYPEEKLKADCEERGGDFNTCGNICDPASAQACPAVCAYTCDLGPEKDEGGAKTEDWEIYANKDLGFELKHPADWSLKTPDTPYGKVVRIKKTGDDLDGDQLTGITHLSIYPQGLPREGVLGSRATSGLELNFETKRNQKLVLESGETWAYHISFAEYPKNWNQDNFIWASLKVNDLETRCFREGEEISSEECDPLLTDDQIRRSGEVDSKDRQILEAMLKSFKFTVPVEAGTEEEMIRVDSPQPNQVVTSPLEVEGEARGSWFFEASFPYVLEDSEGNILQEGSIQTNENWMTEDFVSFSQEIEFPAGESEAATLIFEKANPSGLEENAGSKEIELRLE